VCGSLTAVVQSDRIEKVRNFWWLFFVLGNQKKKIPSIEWFWFDKEEGIQRGCFHLELGFFFLSSDQNTLFLLNFVRIGVGFQEKTMRFKSNYIGVERIFCFFDWGQPHLNKRISTIHRGMGCFEG
jgi:hypothetical protein